MNSYIIDIFEELIIKFKSDYYNLIINGHVNDITSSKYRWLSTVRALNKIKSIPYKITSGNQLSQIQGIGKGTIDRIDEILKTGTLSELPNKNIDTYHLINELDKIIGVGNKTAVKLAKQYHLRSVEDFKQKVLTGKIKVNNKIKLGLKYYGIVQRNIPRSEISYVKKILTRELHNVHPSLKLIICGSYRRGKLISGDIDVLIYSTKIKTKHQIINFNKYNLQPYLKLFVDRLFAKKYLVDHITSRNYISDYMGFFKYSNKPVRRIDIKFIPYDNIAPSMLYFTGPATLNIIMRNAAKRNNMLLNQYGLFKLANNKLVQLPIRTERDIFNALGFKYLTPAERDNYK